MITVKERKEYAEAEAALKKAKFFKKFGKLQTPNCYLCSAAKSDKYVKVLRFSVDYDAHRDALVFECHCHGDTIRLYRDYEETMRLNKLDTRMVFKPNQGYREDGIIKTGLSRRHEQDETHAY